MKRMIRITSLAIATLAISTAAMAQQGGGGSGGGGGGGEGGGGDTSVIELRLQDHERARQSRALAERRAGARGCVTHACNEPQQPPLRRASYAPPSQSCAGGEMWVVRDRAGNIVRVVCERW